MPTIIRSWSFCSSFFSSVFSSSLGLLAGGDGGVVREAVDNMPRPWTGVVIVLYEWDINGNVCLLLPLSLLLNRIGGVDQVVSLFRVLRLHYEWDYSGLQCTAPFIFFP
jgi:hypothetical protein